MESAPGAELAGVSRQEVAAALATAAASSPGVARVETGAPPAPRPCAPPPVAPPAADGAPPLPSAEDHKTLGNTHYAAQRYSQAAEAYGAAIAAQPDVAAYHANRAAANIMLRRFAAALADAQTATALDPGHAKAHARAAKAALSLGRCAEASESYARALGCDPGAAAVREESAGVAVVAACLDSAAAAVASGDGQKALASATRGLERAPACQALHALKVRALLLLDRAPEAIAAARELDCDGNSEAMALRADALYRAGNLAMAQRVLEEALRRDPDASACARGLKRIRQLNVAKDAGNAAFNAGQYEEAFERYSAGLAVDPSLRSGFAAALRTNRAAAAAKLGRHAEAVSDCDAALELEPENVKALLRRAAAQGALGEHEQAVRDAEKAAAVAPEHPGVRAAVAEAKKALKASKRVDYYKLLELDKSASDSDVKKAYRKAALKFHPDKAAASDLSPQEAERMFKLVGEANAVLSDAAKRRKYDAGLTLEEIDQGMEPGMGGMGGFGGGSPFGGMEPDDLAAFFAATQGGGFPGGGFPGGGGFHHAHGGGGGGGFRRRGGPGAGW